MKTLTKTIDSTDLDWDEIAHRYNCINNIPITGIAFCGHVRTRSGPMIKEYKIACPICEALFEFPTVL